MGRQTATGHESRRAIVEDRPTDASFDPNSDAAATEMIELIGIALIILLIVVASVAYLFVYYFRFRWQLRDMEQENRRLIDQILMLERENDLLRRSLPAGSEEKLQSGKQ